MQGTEHRLEDPELVDEGPHLDLSFWLHLAAWGTLAKWEREDQIKPNMYHSLHNLMSIHIIKAVSSDILPAVSENLP